MKFGDNKNCDLAVYHDFATLSRPGDWRRAGVQKFCGGRVGVVKFRESEQKQKTAPVTVRLSEWPACPGNTRQADNIYSLPDSFL